jgi:hypothetical protein
LLVKAARVRATPDLVEDMSLLLEAVQVLVEVVRVFSPKSVSRNHGILVEAARVLVEGLRMSIEDVRVY